MASLTLTNIIIIWFIIEINNFIFITYMSHKLKTKKIAFLYFLIQATASFFFIFRIIFRPIMQSEYSYATLMISLLTKIGVPPFHPWMPLISKSIRWYILFLLLTFQKIIPLNMLALIKIRTGTIIFIITMTIVVPTVVSFNLTRIKKILVYSSINHSGWIITLIYIKHPFWIVYMYIYTITMGRVSFILSESKISIKYNQYMFKKFNPIFTIIIINLARIPPFSFFIYKWFTTFLVIIESNLKLIIILMLINSLIITFIYIKITLWSLFISRFKIKIKLCTIKIKIIKISVLLTSLAFPIILM